MDQDDDEAFEGLGFDFDFFGVKPASATPTVPVQGTGVKSGVGFLDPISAIVGGVGGAASAYFQGKAMDKAGKDALKLQQLQSKAMIQQAEIDAQRRGSNTMTIATVGVLALAGLLVFGIVRSKK